MAPKIVTSHLQGLLSFHSIFPIVVYMRLAACKTCRLASSALAISVNEAASLLCAAWQLRLGQSCSLWATGFQRHSCRSRPLWLVRRLPRALFATTSEQATGLCY